MVREKNSSRSGKVREFYFESWKIGILKKSQGKLEYDTADFIQLMAWRNISGQCDLSDMFFLGSGGWRPLLNLTFWIYLVREIIFSSGKSQGILKAYICGNHDFICVIVIFLWGPQVYQFDYCQVSPSLNKVLLTYLLTYYLASKKAILRYPSYSADAAKKFWDP